LATAEWLRSALVAQASAKTKLATWRQRRGVTQEELARATGLSTSVYWRLENGHYDNPPIRYLVNCALALGCSLDDLIEGEWREWMVLDQRASAAPDPAAFWRERQPE
jgi:transcriptional regulator with XRE-family HTH domain